MSHSANFNISHNQGADFSRQFQLKDGASATDLTNYTFTGKVKSHHTATTALTLHTTVTDASNGRFHIHMSDAQVNTLKPGTYVYDLIATDGSGNKNTLIRGYFELEPGISQ